MFFMWLFGVHSIVYWRHCSLCDVHFWHFYHIGQLYKHRLFLGSVFCFPTSVVVFFCCLFVCFYATIMLFWWLEPCGASSNQVEWCLPLSHPWTRFGSTGVLCVSIWIWDLSISLKTTIVILILISLSLLCGCFHIINSSLWILEGFPYFCVFCKSSYQCFVIFLSKIIFLLNLLLHVIFCSHYDHHCKPDFFSHQLHYCCIKILLEFMSILYPTTSKFFITSVPVQMLDAIMSVQSCICSLVYAIMSLQTATLWFFRTYLHAFYFLLLTNFSEFTLWSMAGESGHAYLVSDVERTNLNFSMLHML